MFAQQSILGRVVSQIVLAICVVILAAPLALIVRLSFGGEGWRNFVVIVGTTPFLRFLSNSFVIAVVTVALVLIMAMAAAYATAVLRPRGASLITVLILAGLSMPAIALAVPVFSLVQTFGLFDTYWAVIIPLTALSIPFGVLVGGNYIRAIPVEIFEAAKLDGSGSFRTLVSIVVPICRPVLSVIAIFSFLAAWNEYLLPLLFLQDVDLKVVTQVPTYFQSQRLVDTPKVFAANVLISLPIVAVYLALQRTFRRGLTGGAVK
ncbi:carbohydrate ABC transporter permease [Nonomuraea sp. KM88]|uniref:carbohydrate ABC transporter permease n=1 Tax=Nonomuraea sp. KM88 TaxID=3457427 RepID=UPI003FCCBB53